MLTCLTEESDRKECQNDRPNPSPVPPSLPEPSFSPSPRLTCLTPIICLYDPSMSVNAVEERIHDRIW